MKRFRRIRAALGLCVLATLAGLVPPRAAAQGESAVPFLLIAPNSRAAGMGESGAGVVDDASAIFWNPAALAFLKGSEISLTHANWLPQFGLSDLFYDFLTFRQDIDAIGGTIGASVTYLSLGEFSVTNSSGPTVIDKFKSFEYAVTLGYATRAFDELGVGLNVRFIHSALSPIGTESEQGEGIASTVAFDLALMYRPQALEGFSLGVNLSNLGPKVTYIDAAQADPLPTNLRIGLGYRVLEDEYNQITASLDFSRLLVHRNEDGTSDPFYKAMVTTWSDGSGMKKFNISGGVEYWYGSPKLIALRVGYFYEDPNYGNRKFMTFGAGIRYDIYGFDFSYISAAENHPLSDTMRFSLLIAWGGVQ